MNLQRLCADLQAGRTTPRKVVARSLSEATDEASAGVWIALADASVLQQEAAALEQAGPRGKPLYGVPFAVKDNLDVEGMDTTAGCPAFAYPAQETAVAVQRLRDAGALLIGKTNLDQFATGLAGMRSPYGAPRSAFDERYVSGGSSSGSAVAVARGTVAFALGTDTAGSGRVPAALNGIVGLKPTRGIVSTDGLVPACRSLDCVSVFAADADGAARVFAELARDPQRTGAVPVRRAAGSRLRLAIPRADQVDVGPECRVAWDLAVAAAAALDLELVEVNIEPLLEAASLVYGGPWIAERYESVGAFIEQHPGETDPTVAEIILGGAAWTAAQAQSGRDRLAALAEKALAIWSVGDVLLLPTIPEPATPSAVMVDPIGSNARLGTYTNFVNLLDMAAVAVPAGLDDNGMTFGVTLIGPAFSDDLLLDLARRWPSGGGHVSDRIDIAVCGAHMSGLSLNDELLSRGGGLIAHAQTAPHYRLVALPGGPPARPGLIRCSDDEPGTAIALEVWRLSAAAAGDLLSTVPAPLAIGTVELSDGSRVRGFVCEGYAADAAEDISQYGGWREYIASGAAV